MGHEISESEFLNLSEKLEENQGKSIIIKKKFKKHSIYIIGGNVTGFHGDKNVYKIDFDT